MLKSSQKLLWRRESNIYIKKGFLTSMDQLVNSNKLYINVNGNWPVIDRIKEA